MSTIPNNAFRATTRAGLAGQADRGWRTCRRSFLATLATASAGSMAGPTWAADREIDFPRYKKAQIAITLDLEMSRNFPNWQDAQWDYQKGNLNQEAKDYTVESCRRVKARGGLIHTFVVGQVFEQEDVGWLSKIAEEGHPIGNHTYDHVYVLAEKREDLQYRFARAPWLIGNRDIASVIRDNIVLTSRALKQRIGVEANGFRTPGGFADGLHGREDIQRLLQSLGFDWVSCRYPAHAGMEDLHGTNRRPAPSALENILAAQRQSQPFLYPTGLLDLPMSPVSDIGAFRTGRWKLQYFKDAIRRAFAWAVENRGMFDFLAHPSCLGVVDPKFEAIDLICDLVEKSGDRAELVTLDVIANRARAQFDGREAVE